LSNFTNTNASLGEEATEEQLESGFFNEYGYVILQNRPAINPDFAPDESCDIDLYQLKCIPGSEQDCPEGWQNGEDNICSPSGPCPEGYHGADDDETGQCYSNEEGCKGMISNRIPYILLTDRPGKGDRCANPNYLCNEDPTHEVCKLVNE
jgi:hypothetical protein